MLAAEYDHRSVPARFLITSGAALRASMFLRERAFGSADLRHVVAGRGPSLLRPTDGQLHRRSRMQCARLASRRASHASERPRGYVPEIHPPASNELETAKGGIPGRAVDFRRTVQSRSVGHPVLVAVTTAESDVRLGPYPTDCDEPTRSIPGASFDQGIWRSSTQQLDRDGRFGGLWTS
jgi:hypothetical protein